MQQPGRLLASQAGRLCYIPCRASAGSPAPTSSIVGSLNWTKINPDIFGSMIQAVADDEERGALGMHSTSVPNILKVSRSGAGTIPFPFGTARSSQSLLVKPVIVLAEAARDLELAGIYYDEIDDEVRVFAVLDLRRDPLWIRQNLPEDVSENSSMRGRFFRAEAGL